MEEININELGVQVGIKVNDFFERLKSKFPDTIKAIHGLGAMLAIELVDQNGNPAADLTKKVLHFANENGLILISAGVNGNYIRILSPLVISDAHLFKGFEIIENAFNALL
jgi:4-aminobutyrate aminotransferase-like enzyme